MPCGFLPEVVEEFAFRDGLVVTTRASRTVDIKRCTAVSGIRLCLRLCGATGKSVDSFLVAELNAGSEGEKGTEEELK